MKKILLKTKYKMAIEKVIKGLNLNKNNPEKQSAKNKTR
jgi:hypothetical protein